MIVYRVSSGEYETRLWNGNGGLNFDGRWNTKGHRIVYTSECLALAVLENLVNIGRFSRFEKYFKARAEIPEKFIIEINELLLMKNRWNDPEIGHETQEIGDRWLKEKKSAVLRVPSAVLNSECDFLLNPEHPDFGKLNLYPAVPLEIDPRLCV
jgi:RES domain-containing protein